jgi:ribonuclease III
LANSFTNSFKSIFSADKHLLKAIKHIFGFYPANINLYKQALRHKSVALEIRNGVKNSNERLEFLGDAVLSSVIADYLFKRFPYKDEGFLTEMRSKLVSRSHLNSICSKIGLDKFIQINESGSLSGSIKGNAFESLIGAIYIDKGYDFTRKVIVNKIIRFHLDIDEIESKELNFKSRLLEWTQKEKRTLEYKVVDTKDNNHNKLYFVEVEIDNHVEGKGSGFSIKAAEQSAAENALNLMFGQE